MENWEVMNEAVSTEFAQPQTLWAQLGTTTMYAAQKSDFRGIVLLKISHSKLSKRAQKRKGTTKGKINSFGNCRRTREVIAACCSTFSNIYYSIHLCLLPRLSIKMPPGIMVYRNTNMVQTILIYGWKGAYHNT